jgi:hypothetical protein
MKRRRGVTVLGRELAAARANEELHRAATGDVASPLAGVEYDVGSGAYDLHRFVESPVDAAVAAFLAGYVEQDDAEAAATRAALRLEDFYTLTTFSVRAALASIRGREKPSLDDALAALTAIAEARVDPRDVGNAAWVVAWAIARSGRDHAAALRRAAERSEPGPRRLLRALAAKPAAELQPGRYRCVSTPDGPALFEDDYQPFAPSVDLVALAFAVQDVVERDRYRISSMTVASDLPDVWLTGDVEPQRAAIRGCVSVGTGFADDQLFLAFLAEAGDAADAATLAAAAVPARTYEALGLASGAICCVLAARSVVAGVRSVERRGSLRRFAEPLQAALDRFG